MVVPTIKLNNGTEIPALGLGTYLSTNDDGRNAIKIAIEAGYKLIDTAYFYQNEKEIGEVVNEKIGSGEIKRDDVYIVTKLWNIYHDPATVESACRKSLTNLGLDYIDLYLMHTPIGYELRDPEDLFPTDEAGNIQFTDFDYLDTYKAMEKLVDLGLVKSIGLSNFNSEQITRVLDNARIKPVVNQVECSPTLNQKDLTAFCKARDIVIMSYSPMGRPHAYEKDKNLPKPALLNEKVQEIAQKYNKTPGQIILRYLYELGTVPIPKSTNPNRIRQNIDIFDFELTADEKQFMDSLHTGERSVAFSKCVKHKYFMFNIPF